MKNAAQDITAQDRKTVNYRTRDGRQFFIESATCPIDIYQFGIRSVTLFRGTYIITRSLLAKLSIIHNMVDVSPITND